MNLNVKSAYKAILDKETRTFAIFCIIAILSPITALLMPAPLLLLIEEYRPEFFARSGAAMVVFALMAEASAIRVLNLFRPTNVFVEQGFNEFAREYVKRPAVLNKISFLLIAAGTLIWGYGDLMYTLILE